MVENDVATLGNAVNLYAIIKSAARAYVNRAIVARCIDVQATTTLRFDNRVVVGANQQITGVIVVLDDEVIARGK